MAARYYFEDPEDEDEVRYGLRYQEDLHQNEKGFAATPGVSSSSDSGGGWVGGRETL